MLNQRTTMLIMQTNLSNLIIKSLAMSMKLYH